MVNFKISLFELLKCLSSAQDLVSPEVVNHHQQVAYLSYRIACEMELSLPEQKDIFLAGLVHDIGALSVDERLDIIENEPKYINNHAFVGARLFGDFKPMQESAEIIRFHHIPWKDGKGRIFKGNPVPLGSHVIHLADRICTKLDPDMNVLSQISNVRAYVSENTGLLFNPSAAAAFERIAGRECMWLDLVSSKPADRVNIEMYDIVKLEMDDLIDLAAVFAHIIDFRSSFTAVHSAGVACTAGILADMSGFSEFEYKMILVAGYLHDLGKLAVPNAILEKPARLNEDEFNVIRTHTYHTFHLLNTMPQLNEITTWAAYHHERIDGRGYPFHISGEGLPTGSRIMAVADIFTAIMENRPYRRGMDTGTARQVIEYQVKDGALDEKIAGLLLDNFEYINSSRIEAQKKAELYYKSFFEGI